jgi:long-chain acyl-CoA synthetase
MIKAKTLPEAFLDAACEHGSKTAIYFFENGKYQGLPYKELIERSKAVSLFLKEEGISQGDRIAIISPARIEWYFAFLGTVLLSAIPVPVNEMASEGEVRAILEDASPKLIFTAKETAHLGKLLKGAKLVELGSDEFKKKMGVRGLVNPRWGPGAKPLQIKGVEPPQINKNPDDVAVILYTSGTTGPPKGVMLTHGNLISDVNGLLETGIIGEGEHLFGGLPLYHAYPLMGEIIAPLTVGATVTLLHSMKELPQAASETRPTIIIAVPQMLEIFAANVEKKLPPFLRPSIRLSFFLKSRLGINAGKVIFGKVHKALGGKIKVLASGGARLSPDVMETLEGIGFKVVEGYGLTETSPVAAFNPLNKRKPGSVGKPLMGTEIKIKDGEILIQGPIVMKGYRGKPRETAEVMEDGFFHTGDLGYMDKDGYVFITGRKKEMIVLASGKNINPEDVEKAYGTTPLIKEIGVYEDRGSLRAVIVPDLDRAKERKISNIRESLGWEMKDISQRLPSYMRLTGYEITTGTLPKTSLGKIKRYKLRELLAGAPKEETDPEILKDPAGKKVAKSFSLLMGKDVPLRKEKNLELDLGLDSLKKLELLSSLEEEFLPKGERLPDDFLVDVQTVGELIEKLKHVSGFLVEEEKEPEGEKAIHRALAVPTAIFIRVLTKILFRAEASGLENLPEAPHILAPNHTSFIDAFVVAGVLPKSELMRLYFQGLVKFFRAFPLSFMGKVLHVIPIDTEEHLGSAIRRSEEALKEGKSLCIFPEGGRSYDGNLMELKKGIARVALKSGAPVVPVWIKGARRALGKGSFCLKPVKVRVAFGPPIETKGLIDSDELFLSRLRESLSALAREAGGA